MYQKTPINIHKPNNFNESRTWILPISKTPKPHQKTYFPPPFDPPILINYILSSTELQFAIISTHSCPFHPIQIN